MILHDLGVLPFAEAFALQEETVRRVAAGRQEETLHLVVHPHVFTVGSGGDAQNLLAGFDPEGRPIDLVRINRGGDVTYHGPGQLVGYPHLDLRGRGRDVGLFLRTLERSLLDTAAHFGVRAFRREGLTGVWTRRGKLGSIGVGVRRWVTMHGFALNLDPDMRYFRMINPCGMAGCPMTSLAAEADAVPAMEEVKEVYWRSFRRVFG